MGVLTNWNEPERVAKHNDKTREMLSAAKETHGYLACYLGGQKIHAAVALTKGWGGYIHPRALCQKATPNSYASPHEEHRQVTCLRCIASLENLKSAVGATGDTQ